MGSVSWVVTVEHDGGEVEIERQLHSWGMTRGYALAMLTILDTERWLEYEVWVTAFNGEEPWWRMTARDWMHGE